MTQPSPPTTRRFPSPWVAVPVLLATGVGWFVGSRVARLSCEPADCTGSEVVWGLIGAIVGFVGMLVVAVLVVRSLAEWAALSAQDKQRRAQQRQAKRDSGEPPTC